MARSSRVALFAVLVFTAVTALLIAGIPGPAGSDRPPVERPAAAAPAPSP